MKFRILASGSKGNCLFIASQHARLLVDAGLSARQIEKRMLQAGISPSELDAIVLTHDHGDHVRGVGVLSRRWSIPIVAHPDTLDNISYQFTGKEPIQPWHDTFTIKDLTFTPFSLPHDSFPTVGYLVSDGDSNLAICTDLGMMTPEVVENLQQAHAILLESNHDPDMLMNGPYPWHLKERIAGRLGHLSNQDAGEILQAVLGLHSRLVVLGHLSEENNRPDLARQTVLEFVHPDFHDIIQVIEQRTMSPWYQI